MVDYTTDEDGQNRIGRECLEVFISLMLLILRSEIFVIGDRSYGKVEFFKFLKGLGEFCPDINLLDKWGKFNILHSTGGMMGYLILIITITQMAGNSLKIEWILGCC